MDLTKRRNAVLLMTMALMLLVIAAVLAVDGFFDPTGLTMVAPGVLAA
ncbi:MAG: hypothetical protein M3N33_11790 [Actinomycetota bacterium]|nr:hypothetical protein [Actinomycetota bacterium]